MEKACTTEVSCVLINIPTEDIHLAKGEMVGFLIQTVTELDEVTTVPDFNVPCHKEDYCGESGREYNIPKGKI